VNLNLLPPLVALLEERHVSRAAERLRLSQPAMSRALQQLRRSFGDELLVRGPDSYTLTPRAQRIRGQLATTVTHLERLFAPETFDAATAAQSFRLAVSDYTVSALGPALVRTILTQSPNATVTCEPLDEGVFEKLDAGTLDLLIYGRAAPDRYRSQASFHRPVRLRRGRRASPGTGHIGVPDPVPAVATSEHRLRPAGSRSGTPGQRRRAAHRCEHAVLRAGGERLARHRAGVDRAGTTCAPLRQPRPNTGAPRPARIRRPAFLRGLAPTSGWRPVAPLAARYRPHRRRDDGARRMSNVHFPCAGKLCGLSGSQPGLCVLQKK
jgi:DNA-binding transcriptional LysR family regulator